MLVHQVHNEPMPKGVMNVEYRYSGLLRASTGFESGVELIQ